MNFKIVQLRLVGFVAFPVMLLASQSLFAAEVWTQIGVGANSNNLTGTLADTTVVMSSTSASISVAPSINPPYNMYDIWDNKASTSYGGIPVFPNGANLYPTSLKGNPQFVTSANSPNNISINFSSPILNPTLVVYSLDSGIVDFSETKQSNGNSARVTGLANNAGTFDSNAKTLIRSAISGHAFPEGCSQETPTTGRACGVIRFRGIYSQINLTMQNTGGGVGFQIGFDPAAVTNSQPAPVPTLNKWTVVGLSSLIAMLGIAWRRKSRSRI